MLTHDPYETKNFPIAVTFKYFFAYRIGSLLPCTCLLLVFKYNVMLRKEVKSSSVSTDERYGSFNLSAPGGGKNKVIISGAKILKDGVRGVNPLYL